MNSMSKIYANLVFTKVKTIEMVPAKLQEEVKAIVKDLEAARLAKIAEMEAMNEQE